MTVSAKKCQKMTILANKILRKKVSTKNIIKNNMFGYYY